MDRNILKFDVHNLDITICILLQDKFIFFLKNIDVGHSITIYIETNAMFTENFYRR